MRSKLGNSLWGLFFIVIGIGFAGNVFDLWDFHLFFDGWWTLFIIIPCVISIIQNGFNIGSTIGLTIGVMLLLSRQDILDMRFVSRLILPVIFLIIGFGILLRSIFFKPRNWENIHTSFQNGGFNYTAVLSSQKIRYPQEVFKGADVTAVFGGVNLDLRDAVIDQDVYISYVAVFGGGDIYVPHNVTVKVSSVPIFGGVSNHTMHSPGGDEHILYLNATCIFGGVDIK